MLNRDMSRRTLLKGGGAALAGLSTLQVAGPARAFPGEADETVLPWIDQPAPSPFPPQFVQLKWEALDSWLIPNDEFFVVYHFDLPALNPESYRLAITGLVSRPQSLRLADLKLRPRREQIVTLECSGDHGFPFFTGAVGNAEWAGTPLAPLLQRAGLRDRASEVVFYGADSTRLTIRDNPGVLNGGSTGTTTADDSGGLDLTVTERFARSMSIEEALNPDNLLCYEMNGAPLPAAHGSPVRLIAPGWYGVANVKWLTHIEVVDQRYAGRFMARDYVSIREEKRDGQTLWTFRTSSTTGSSPRRRRSRAGAIATPSWARPGERPSLTSR